MNQENFQVASELGDEGTPVVPRSRRTTSRAAGHQGPDPGRGLAADQGRGQPSTHGQGVQQALEEPCPHIGLHMEGRV